VDLLLPRHFDSHNCLRWHGVFSRKDDAEIAALRDAWEAAYRVNEYIANKRKLSDLETA